MTVPTPTLPPSSQPAVNTLASIAVRASRTERPVRATSPVIRPSRGPGPSPAPTYSTVDTALSRTAPSISATRAGTDSGAVSTASLASTVTAMTMTLATVPIPGLFRSGIQASSTATPTTAEATPMVIGVCRVSP